MDPVTGRIGSIVYCNGKNACGDPALLAATCVKTSCARPTIDSCTRTINFPEYKPESVIEAPYVSWNHVIKRGYWCMPVCILNENRHPKMALASSLPSHEDLCKQNAIHGRCGIDFNP